MKIALGSTSQHKREALLGACKMMGFDGLEIISIAAESAIAKQPVDLPWIVAGARNRALYTSEKCPDVPVVGIENGVMRAWNIYIDIAAITVVMPNGSWHYGTTPGVEIPERVVKEAQTRGFDTTTIGDILAEQVACDPADPHSVLTGGKLTRADLLTQGIYAVFTQISW